MQVNKYAAKPRNFGITITGSLASLAKNPELAIKPVFPNEKTIKYAKYGSERFTEREGSPEQGVVAYLAILGITSTYPCPLLIQVEGMDEETKRGNCYTATDDAEQGACFIHPGQTTPILAEPIKLIAVDPEYSKKILYSNPMQFNVADITAELSPIVVNGNPTDLLQVPATSPIIKTLRDNEDVSYEGILFKNELVREHADAETGKPVYHVHKKVVDYILGEYAKKDNPEDLKTYDLRKLGIGIVRQDAPKFDTPLEVYQGNKEVGDKVLETECSLFLAVQIIYRLLDVTFADNGASSSYASSSSSSEGSASDTDSSQTESEKTDTDDE